MSSMFKQWCCIFLLALVSWYTQVVSSGHETHEHGTSSYRNSSSRKANPFTPKASLIRYWNMKISNNNLMIKPPPFLISKASPLNPVDYAYLNKVASQHKLSTHLFALCIPANLLCKLDSDDLYLPNPKPKHVSDSNFTSYTSKEFTNYGSSRRRGVDWFKNYSLEVSMPTNRFSHYSPTSTGHREEFTGYSDNANVGDDGFTAYGTRASGGSGEFTRYEPKVNVPDLKFTSYDSRSNGHKLSFTTYAEDANSGKETFLSYGKNGKGQALGFMQYGDATNILSSTFTGYSEMGIGANDSFKGYTAKGNKPRNNFKSYGVGGKHGVDRFTNYMDGANVGDDSFQFYDGRNGGSAKASFVNYGKSFNEGTDTFNEYGKGGRGGRNISFATYGVNNNNTFKGYGADRKGIKFTAYATANGSSFSWVVEEGKFFRESMLQKGKVMKMPDIRDRMPKRSFLPRSILSKLPFSTKESEINELNHIFHAKDNSTMEHVIRTTLEECERPPSRGETKKCVGSMEDMIDYALSLLGPHVLVRTTENVQGSGQKVLLGSVTTDGKLTRSVSCHQSLFPYLLYYCHSVPRVRIYEADILSLHTRHKINHGIAICHLDTSDWSPAHAAFLALGSKPGRIEVCHWIYENDMTWAALAP